ncbi:MAG: hypothetical protein AAGG11_22715 [Pseudomonadota bacterium]
MNHSAIDHATEHATELALDDLSVRLLVSLRTRSWSRLLELLAWIQDQQGHIVFLKTHTAGEQETQVNLGIDGISSTELRGALATGYDFGGMRIEHLHHRQKGAPSRGGCCR